MIETNFREVPKFMIFDQKILNFTFSLVKIALLGFVVVARFDLLFGTERMKRSGYIVFSSCSLKYFLRHIFSKLSNRLSKPK